MLKLPDGSKVEVFGPDSDLVPVLQLNAGAVSSGCAARSRTPSMLQGLPMTPTR
jgi:hypothetical protein